MKTSHPRVALMFALTLVLNGCMGVETESQIDLPTNQKESNEDQAHAHGDADKLVWVKKDVEQDGFLISLGHHGDHFHSGDTVEPAVMITKDGVDVADAVVKNSLLSKQDSSVLVEQAATTYEPETDEEPAHYAQGGLKLPASAKSFVIRFEIQLPGVAETRTFDIDVSLAH